MAQDEVDAESFQEVKEVMLGLMPDVVGDYSLAMDSSSVDISRHTTLVFTESEDKLLPYPDVVGVGGRDIEIVCNLPGLVDSWEAIYAEAGIDADTRRRLYLCTGLASVGLVHLALDAKGATGDDLSDKLRRIGSIMERLHDKATVERKIEELEVAGEIEATLYPFELTEDDIQLVNHLRYGMGIAYLVNDITLEQREFLSQAFRINFAEYLKRLGEGLIEFAYTFGLKEKVDPEAYKQHGLSRAFHTFHFAGIFPMYLSDIIDSTKEGR